MKKYILSIIAFALCMLGAKAQDLNVADVTIKAGETKIVNICLNNTQANIVSFQMDMTLPDGITLNKADCEALVTKAWTDSVRYVSSGHKESGATGNCIDGNNNVVSITYGE